MRTAFVTAAAILSMWVPLARGNLSAEGPLIITPGQFDAGTVDEGRVITATATIENKGNAIVQITNIRTN
jgi:hypothetical protein